MLFCVSGATFACTTTGWSNVVPAVGEAGSPIAGSPAAVSRYSQLCGMAVGGTSYVESVLASDNHYIGRFYVYPAITGGSGDADILVAINLAL